VAGKGLLKISVFFFQILHVNLSCCLSKNVSKMLEVVTLGILSLPFFGLKFARCFHVCLAQA